MKRALLAITILLVAGAAGLYVLVVRPLIAPAQSTPAVESALATPDVVLLAGVNVKQAAFIERWLLGVPVTAVAHDAPARSPLDRTLLDHLRAAHVDVRGDLDYVLYALYRTASADLRHAVVLVGRFDPGAIEGYLARELHGVPREAGGRLSHELTMIAPTDCKPAGTWMVTADRSWILLADPSSHAVVLPRLVAPATYEPDQLAWWRGLARTDLVSVGLWDVKDADQAVPHPFQKGMAKGLSTEAGVFAHLYFGLGVRTVPPDGRLRLVLDAADASVAAQKIAGWQKALSESTAVIRRMFGDEFHDGPRRYATKVKNAQEAHEAIRPSNFGATPASLEMRSLTVLKLRSDSKMSVTSEMRSMNTNERILRNVSCSACSTEWKKTEAEVTLVETSHST